MERVSPEGRACGGCTACCRWFQVKEIGKPEKEWCVHCDKGRGCRIYDHRSHACRAFRCAWREGFGEDGDRPDKSHCILTEQRLDIFGQGLIIVEMRDGAADRSCLVAQMKRVAISGKMPIWIKRFRTQDEFYVVDSFVIPEERLKSLLADRVRVFRCIVLSTTELGG